MAVEKSKFQFYPNNKFTTHPLSELIRLHLQAKLLVIPFSINYWIRYSFRNKKWQYPNLILFCLISNNRKQDFFFWAQDKFLYPKLFHAFSRNKLIWIKKDEFNDDILPHGHWKYWISVLIIYYSQNEKKNSFSSSLGSLESSIQTENDKVSRNHFDLFPNLGISFDDKKKQCGECQLQTTDHPIRLPGFKSVWITRKWIICLEKQSVSKTQLHRQLPGFLFI